QQIQAEKQKLIKEGKLKKEKTLPPVSPEEVPFEIPQNWMWVRFGTIADMLSGFAFKSKDFKKMGKYRLLRGINLGVNSIRWDDTVFVDNIQDKHSDYKLECGDVILGLDRPWISNGTRVAIYNNNEETYLVQRVLRVRGFSYLLNTFIALILNSPLLKNPIGEYTTGISVPHISPNQVGSIIVPLPPLAEQKRIADVLERALGEIDNRQ
ncbi:MAG: hypothetical protein GXY08_07150, partial [Ruminococcus sp.]|nr:hypothetical protein [Ruminococcus sp.]